MMQKSLLYLLLLTFSWTVSYGQAGKDSLSPIRFTRGELEKIAGTALSLKACDKLTELQELQLDTRAEKIQNQQLIIHSRDTVILAQDSIIGTHKGIITLKDEELDVVKTENKELTSKLKLTKMAWVGSVAGVFVLWVLTSLK